MMSTTQISLTLPVELIEQVDAKAETEYTSRADIIRRAILEYLRSEQ